MACTVLCCVNAASEASCRVRQARPAAAAAARPSARLRWPTPQPPQPRRSPGQRQSAVLDRGSGSGGAGVLDRPGFETLGPGGGPATDSAGAKLDSNGGRGLGGGSWRVLLIDSDKHTEERCVDAITTGKQAGCRLHTNASVCAGEAHPCRSTGAKQPAPSKFCSSKLTAPCLVYHSRLQ